MGYKGWSYILNWINPIIKGVEGVAIMKQVSKKISFANALVQTCNCGSKK